MSGLTKLERWGEPEQGGGGVEDEGILVITYAIVVDLSGGG